MPTNIIIPFHKIWADKILSGDKVVEFRTKIFSKRPDKIYMYVSGLRKVVGYFVVGEVYEGVPETLLHMMVAKEKITPKDATKVMEGYFLGKTHGYAIEVADYEKMNPMTLEEFTHEFGYAPIKGVLQSFRYLRRN